MPPASEILRDAIEALKRAGVDDPERDAQLLLLHVLGIPRHRLRDALDGGLSPEAAEAFRKAIAARALRQPVSQITGRRAFWKHDFAVTQDTLDPRPETELLVEAALAQQFDTVLDLGTGTGAVLISVLADRPSARGVGADLSNAALDVARRNAQVIGVQADFVHSDWFSAISGRFDLILSNPPYIAQAEMQSLAPEVREWEPRMALTDEGDGLAAYRAICAGAPAHLSPGGWLMVEIGPSQGNAVATLMRQAGLTDVRVRKDLGGRDRVVQGRNPEATAN